MFRTTIQPGTYNRAVAELGLTQVALLSAHGYSPFGVNRLHLFRRLMRTRRTRRRHVVLAALSHNGSVPNLYELLLPARERSKTFFIGREFDPVKVGIDTSGASGKFLFDTALVGNSNAGHSFENGPLRKGVIGRLLTEDERWALIEYMKSIPNQPRQITPFGGPKDPARAWRDKTFYHVKNPGTYNGAPSLEASNRATKTAIEQGVAP